MMFELKAPASETPNQTIGIEWGESKVLYTCSVPKTTISEHNCTRTIVDYQTRPEINGTAIYLKGELYCSWSMTISNCTFPFELIDPPQYYISKRGYQIFYNLTQTVPVAAANYSQLPKSVESFVDGYQYKALGSEKYLLIARVANDTTDFLLKVNGETPRLVEVKLKNKISINFQLNFENRVPSMLTDYYGWKTDSWYLPDAEIDGDECRWSLSDAFQVRTEPVKLKDTTYQLQIVENNRFVYFDEDNFRLATPASASSSLTIAKSLLTIVLISVIFV